MLLGVVSIKIVCSLGRWLKGDAIKGPEAKQASANIQEKSRTGHFRLSSALVERLGANPPLAGRGAVEVDAAVLHALVEDGKVKAEIGYGVG
jgi:hypothetical protein